VLPEPAVIVAAIARSRRPAVRHPHALEQSAQERGPDAAAGAAHHRPEVVAGCCQRAVNECRGSG
jgi:hypothetical protein